MNLYGVIPDRVYGHDKFERVCKDTEGPLYILLSDHEDEINRIRAEFRLLVREKANDAQL